MATELIERYLSHLRKRGCTPRTIEHFGRTLHALDRELPFGLDAACEEELEDWLWRDGLKPTSRATYYGAMNGFYVWATDHAEELDYNPAKRIERPKVPQGIPRVATDEQVRIVTTEAAEPYRLWGTAAAYEGLRCIEVYRLHREHVTEAKTTVYDGKGGKARAVPTHPLFWAMVEPLPPGPITGVDDERELSRLFLVYCRDRLRIRGLSMHRLRGWWATKTYRVTKDIHAVQQGMGHASPSTTAGYIQPSETALQAGVEGLPTFN